MTAATPAGSLSLNPHDVTDVADRLRHLLPELRGQLSVTLAAAGRAAGASAAVAAGAVHESSGEVQRAVTGLDTSLGRLATALTLAAAELVTQDATMFGRPAATTPPVATLGGGK